MSPRHALTGNRPQSTCGWTSWICIRGDAITDKVNSLAMWLTRSIGVNLHPTSLPGGRLGPEAYAFVDWLAAAGARFWQVLPLNPPDEYGSPYASASAFAAWPGLLADPEAAVAPSELRRFERENAYWIGDWVGFAGGEALAEQARFQREWSALRAYAADRGVRVIGDVPIYVAADSCDHAAHPEIFLPGDFVAGAPPDPLNELRPEVGQPALRLGGAGARRLPLVDRAHATDARPRRRPPDRPLPWLRRLLDGAGGGETAREGHWERGPGAAVFRAAEHELGELPVIVEDLGVITPDVSELRDELGFPGMVVLLWAFGGPADNPHRLENHRVHQVVYTSTHDTDTLAGHFPGRAGVGAPRGGALLPGGARDHADPGRARARVGGANEPAGRRGRQLGLAARAGAARARRRRPAARCRGAEQAVRDDFRRLAHASLTFNAPLSEERANALVAALPISPGHHVLDLGCGWGELLLRILAAHPATTGTGVDTVKEALDRGVRAAAQRGLHGRVEFVEADAARFVDNADVVVCVAASHAWGGVGATLRWLRECVAPGGRVLYGDGFWAASPTSAALEAIGEMPRLDDIRAAARAAGFRIERDDVSTLAEWDAFETSWRAGLEASGVPEAVAFAQRRRREYEDGYRGTIGFSWLVLAPA